MPEALLGGYPKGEGFGTQLGYRLPKVVKRMHAILPMPLMCRCGNRGVGGVVGAHGGQPCDRRNRARGQHVVLHGSVLRSAVRTCRQTSQADAHRYGTLIWGKGDGSTLPVLDSQVGKLGAVVCWENMMPLLRTAMYAKGIEVWCAPTVDEREMWQVSMRHIAHEGRCFVVSACQVQASPNELGVEIANWPADRPLIAGGSVIVGPMGDVLAGPLRGEAG